MRHARTQVDEVGVGEREVFDIALAHVRNGEEQPVRILVRKRPQQHCVSHTEDSRAGADAERNGDDGGGGEHGTFRQGPSGVGEVSQQHPCTSGFRIPARPPAHSRCFAHLPDRG